WARRRMRWRASSPAPATARRCGGPSRWACCKAAASVWASACGCSTWVRKSRRVWWPRLFLTPPENASMVDDIQSFRLQASERAFLQDMFPWVARTPDAPGCRRLQGARVVTLRHLAASPAARDAVQRCGLPWPDATGALEMVDGAQF